LHPQLQRSRNRLARSRGSSSSTRRSPAAAVESRGSSPRWQNHGTFKLYDVAQERRPDLVERFEIERLPTLVVLEGKRVCARLECPRGCREIEEFLAPWLN
jgi:hypothetical protein